MTTHAESIDREFFTKRLSAAAAHRDLVVQNADAFRLVFSEADLLPGLIIDRYGDHLVMQALDQGMDAATPEIAACLQDLFAPASIILRNDASVRRLESLPQETRVLSGTAPDRVEVRLNGYQFDADLIRGQKTGVYLDQRENYAAAARYAHGRALDCFTSTGGFALHLAAKCDHVLAIDSSEPALLSARGNAARNSIGNIEFREANVFDFLAAQSGSSSKFSTIILDPPAFTKSRSAVEAAARGYKDINFRALKMLEPGGVLVTCSCSHHMSEAMLFEVLASAALDAGRTLRVLERRAQSSDHPILLTVPETLYLKCVICQVVA